MRSPTLWPLSELIMLRAVAFDPLVEAYDETFTHTAVGRVLRDMVWARLEKIFQPAQTILELGCGTGEDAVWLARRGVHVVATDASSKMIETARAKARAFGCERYIEFHALPMEQVASAFRGRTFDGVFSN